MRNLSAVPVGWASSPVATRVVANVHPAVVLCLLTILLGAAGCQSSPKTSAQKSSRSTVSTVVQNNDDRADPFARTGGCDSRLQDISGLLLLYSQMNHRLPATLDELRSLPGASDVPDFTCPVSGKPYIYKPDGIPTPSGNGVIVLYDATPAHDGMRLSLVIPKPGRGEAVVTQVLALPESFFKGK